MVIFSPVIATFGSGFWVLDDLQSLEQLGAAHVPSDAPALFKPQQTWLVTRRMSGFGGPKGLGGQNLAPGATVFFHLPAGYHGKTPVTLSFTDATGKLIRSYTLHLKPKGKPKPLSHNPTVAHRQRQRPNQHKGRRQRPGGRPADHRGGAGRQPLRTCGKGIGLERECRERQSAGKPCEQ